MLRAPRNNVREAPMDAAETVALKPTSPVTDSIPLPEGLLVTILRDRLSPFQRAALVGLLIGGLPSFFVRERLSLGAGTFLASTPLPLAILNLFPLALLWLEVAVAHFDCHLSVAPYRSLLLTFSQFRSDNACVCSVQLGVYMASKHNVRELSYV